MFYEYIMTVPCMIHELEIRTTRTMRNFFKNVYNYFPIFFYTQEWYLEICKSACIDYCIFINAKHCFVHVQNSKRLNLVCKYTSFKTSKRSTEYELWLGRD